MAKRKSKETIVANCTRCSARVSATVEGEYNEYFDEPGCSVRWALLRCPDCYAPILISQDDEDARYGHTTEPWSSTQVLYPSVNRRQLGQAVPEPIRKAFTEARTCFDDAKAYTACAIMCRKVLEGICDSHNAKKRKLGPKTQSTFRPGSIGQKTLRMD